MSITKRLAQLEARQVSIHTAPKRLIATALQVTDAARIPKRPAF